MPGGYNYNFLKTFFRVETRGEKKATLASNINIGFSKIDAAVEKKSLKNGRPF
jgi:hypothetical protein